MQKVEAQHKHAQNQPVQRQGGNAVLESPQGEQIAQLEAIAESSPQAGKLAQLAAMVDSSPVMAVQRRLIGQVHNSPVMVAQCKAVEGMHTGPYVTMQRQEVEEPRQEKSENAGGLAVQMISGQKARLTSPVRAFQFKVDSALFTFDDEKDGKETPTKVVNTKTMGGPYVYKFAKDGVVVDSFEENIAKPKTFNGGTVQPGPSPVEHTVDILDTSLTTAEEVAEDSRPKHFRAADKLAGLAKGARTNKLTWHHKLTPCELETVDMNVHGVMSHYGGFSQWKETSVTEDDDG